MISVRRLVATLGLSTALLLSSAGVAAARAGIQRPPARRAHHHRRHGRRPRRTRSRATWVATSISYTRAGSSSRSDARGPRETGRFRRDPHAAHLLRPDLLQARPARVLRPHLSSSGDDVRCRAKSFPRQGNAVVLHRLAPLPGQVPAPSGSAPASRSTTATCSRRRTRTSRSSPTTPAPRDRRGPPALPRIRRG